MVNGLSTTLSDLEEKSARDGLKENQPYRNLRDITGKVINLLETRRFTFRRSEGLSRSGLKVERELEGIFSFEEMKDGVRLALGKNGVEEIIEISLNTEEKKLLKSSSESVKQVNKVLDNLKLFDS